MLHDPSSPFARTTASPREMVLENATGVTAT